LSDEVVTNERMLQGIAFNPVAHAHS
jgi:hypothetical protein